MIKKNNELSEQEKIMFYNFMDWANCVKENRGGKFNITNNAWRSFINGNNITLCYVPPIPKAMNEKNKIYFTKRANYSPIYELMTHIRNAIAHSQITKVDGCFVLHDISKSKKKEDTMQAKVDEDMMQGLLDAIKNNYTIKKKNKK